MPEIKLDNQHFFILEYIYDNPYILYSSLVAAFPSCNDIESIILFLDLNHMISLRIAASPEEDIGKYECRSLEENSHLLSITAGNTVIEQKRQSINALEQSLQPFRAIAEKLSSLAESASAQAESASAQAESASRQADAAEEQSLASMRQADFAIFIDTPALFFL